MTAAYDPTAMLARLNADIGCLAEIVEIFLEKYPPLVQDICRAIAENDARRLKYAAQTLGGAIGNFTVTRPYTIAKQLKAMAETSNGVDSQTTLRAVVQGVDPFSPSLKRGVPNSAL